SRGQYATVFRPQVFDQAIRIDREQCAHIRQERGPKLSDADISRIERDVEAARAKLHTDLARLRAPGTLDDFTERARDTIVYQVKTTTRSAWQSVVDDL